MQAIFAWDCGKNDLESKDTPSITTKIIEIDNIISQNAPKWPIDKINKIDLAILRVALWELLTKKDTPSKVVIDEAIEMAKEFGAESSSSFVNGVLGSAIKVIETHDTESNS